MKFLVFLVLRIRDAILSRREWPEVTAADIGRAFDEYREKSGESSPAARAYTENVIRKATGRRHDA